MVKQFFATVVLIHNPWERSRGRFFPKSPIHITQITLMIHKLSTHTTLLNDPKHILNWIVLLKYLIFYLHYANAQNQWIGTIFSRFSSLDAIQMRLKISFSSGVSMWMSLTL